MQYDNNNFTLKKIDLKRGIYVTLHKPLKNKDINIL